MFVAKNSGEFLEQNYFQNTSVVFAPKQLPSGFSEEQIQASAQATTRVVTAIMIVQIFLQIFLKGSVKTLIDIFMAIQTMVYASLFNLQMSAITEIMLEEFQKLIEFQMLNPQNFVQTFIDEEFTIASWMSGVKNQIASAD